MQNNTTCPSDETLMDFLERRLSRAAREQVESHLAGCADCREQVVLCADLLAADPSGDAMPVPAPVTRKAADSVLALSRADGRNKLRQGVREWLARGTAALERLVWSSGPADVAVRGAGAGLAPEVIRREKQFGDLDATIEIENSGAGQALLRVSGDPGLLAAAPVRVALYTGDREAASSVLGGTAVVFEEIPPGIYTLAFARRGRRLGEYAFEIVDLP